MIGNLDCGRKQGKERTRGIESAQILPPQGLESCWRERLQDLVKSPKRLKSSKDSGKAHGVAGEDLCGGLRGRKQTEATERVINPILMSRASKKVAKKASDVLSLVAKCDAILGVAEGNRFHDGTCELAPEMFGSGSRCHAAVSVNQGLDSNAPHHINSRLTS